MPGISWGSFTYTTSLTVFAKFSVKSRQGQQKLLFNAWTTYYITYDPRGPDIQEQK